MAPIAAKAGLSILIMLLGLLQDGLAKLEKRDYPGAIAAFTKVVEHRAADPALRERATFWRGVAYGKSGKVAEAKTDLGQILSNTRNPDLRGKAFIAFGQLGGDPKALLPKETPKQAFEKTKVLGQADNAVAFRKRVGGDLAAILRMSEMVMDADRQGMGEQVIREISGELAYGGSKVGTGKEFGTATVDVLADTLVLSLQLGAMGKEWQFQSLLAVKQTDVRRIGGGARGNQVGQINDLKQISLQLLMFTDDHEETFPKALQEIKPYLGNKPPMLEVTDPATGKTSPLLYHNLGALGAVKAPSDTYMVATPAAINGQRAVGFCDGHVALVAEAVFLKTAKAQGWKLGPKKPVKVAADVAAKVEVLIKQLGDPKAAVRKAAYRELKKLGEQAEPILSKHRKHPDPEVRLSVRQLLKEESTPVRRANPPPQMGDMFE